MTIVHVSFYVVFQFYDGNAPNNNPLLWTATGLRYPEVVVSTGVKMRIDFYSSLSLNAAGFHIQWSAVSCK